MDSAEASKGLLEQHLDDAFAAELALVGQRAFELAHCEVSLADKLAWYLTEALHRFGATVALVDLYECQLHAHHWHTAGRLHQPVSTVRRCRHQDSRPDSGRSQQAPEHCSNKQHHHKHHHSPDRRCVQRKGAKLSPWAVSLAICFLAAVSYMLGSAMLQYWKHYDMFRRRQAGLNCNATGGSGATLAAANSSQRAAGWSSQAQLAAGAPEPAEANPLSKLFKGGRSAHSCDFSLIVEVVYVSLVYMAISIYIEPFMTHRLLAPHDFATLRMLRDSGRERRYYSRLTRDLLNNLLASSAAYVHKRVELSAPTSGLAVPQRPPPAGPPTARSPGPRRRQLRAPELDLRTVRMVGWQARSEASFRKLALAGQLEPANRKPEWLVLLMRLNALLMGSMLLAALGLAYNIGPALTLIDMSPNSGPDWIMVLAFMALAIAGTFSGQFYLSAVAMGVLDRIRLTSDVSFRARQCALRNGELWRHHLASRAFLGSHALAGSRRRLAETLNENLLLAVLHYKISTEHARHSQITFDSIGSSLAKLLFVGPAIFCLHAPYNNDTLARLLLLVYLVAIFFVDLCLVPGCYLHSRCCEAYAQLARLAAQSTQLEHELGQHGNQHSARLFDPHLLWLLRSELSQPEQLVDKLAIRVFGSSLSYPRFLRINFWATLVLGLTMLMPDQHELSTGPNRRGIAQFMFF